MVGGWAVQDFKINPRDFRSYGPGVVAPPGGLIITGFLHKLIWPQATRTKILKIPEFPAGHALVKPYEDIG